MCSDGHATAVAWTLGTFTYYIQLKEEAGWIILVVGLCRGALSGYNCPGRGALSGYNHQEQEHSQAIIIQDGEHSQITIFQEEEHSQATIVQEGEAVIDTLGAHCQYLHSDQRRALPFP